MRVFRWPAITAALIVAMFGVKDVDAAPILATGTTDARGCSAIVTAPGADVSTCGLFTIDPFAGTLSGSFSDNNDVALLQFALTSSFLFSVESTSFTAGGFDPFFGLFYGADSAAEGQVVRYPNAGETYHALSVDVPSLDGTTYHDALPDPDLQDSLLLGPGNYVLALLQSGNNFQTATFDVAGEPQLLPYLPFGFELNGGFGGIQGCGGVPDPCGFSLSISAVPESASVPEPGTLTLLGLGLAAAAIRHRRKNRPQA
jgi:hypothetical protein